MKLFSAPHRRYNPLTNEWILVSPQRTQRPWLGQVEKLAAESRPAYDPDCYLCPGNARAGGNRNPRYDSTFVFENDFAALLPSLPPLSKTGEGRKSSRGEAQIVFESVDARDDLRRGGGLLRAESERGVCRVICFSPRHDWTLPDMPLAEIRRVVDVWVDQTRELGALDFVDYVQVFENKGAAMGASNPHPHCQVWASEHVPTEPTKELRATAKYLRAHDSCLLCDYLKSELVIGERIVLQNDHFVVLVPFWAVWPFETLVLARRHIGALPEMTDAERDALADLIKQLTTRYDNLFEVSFPYSMGWHQSPTNGAAHATRESHLHAHYYPPLLRSATVRKFMVGYEML
ncbi:MAG: UDP-glucose--hexose-1-phosphate uridylyltransferase, partial [Chloroflexota bacterium]|nr:UDP-glucose--hexose-1-phosphate uridylyltransferase [Chloroflexota bacterium]